MVQSVRGVLVPRLLLAVTLAATFCIGTSWAADDDIIFAPKNFFDGTGDLNVAISGTLTGDGVAYKNNTYSISCLKEFNACFVSSVEQIGDRQIGRMDFVYSYPITKWDPSEVVATEETADWYCARTTITLVRKSQTALWVQEPINQTRPACLKSDTKIHKWTIEDSLGWKRINRK